MWVAGYIFSPLPARNQARREGAIVYVVFAHTSCRIPAEGLGAFRAECSPNCLEFFAMNIRTPFLGDTFIAHSADNVHTICVGIIVGIQDNKCVKTLILGSLTPPTTDVFRKNEMFPFPTYEELWIRDICIHTFKKEIDLCKYHASLHDEMSNLVTENFQINNKKILVCLDVTRHIMFGGGIKTYRKWAPFRDEHFLLLWAVLYKHFPDMVQLPPEEWSSPESEDCFHVCMNGHGDPFITIGSRETLEP